MAAPENQLSLQFRSGFTGELGSMLHKKALEGEGTDVEIRIGETSIETVHAHSLVLRTKSDVFNVMLGERWKTEKKSEDGKIMIDLPEDNYSDFVLFLKLLYGFQGLTSSNFNKVLPAYKLADKYAVHSALQLCDEYFQFLIENLKNLDVARLLWMAKDHQIEKLYEAALEYVKNNLHSFWNHSIQEAKIPYHSWMDWDEETLIEIISTDGLKVSPNQPQDNFSWSANEHEIAFYATTWLHLRKSADNEKDRKSDEPPTHIEQQAVDLDSASRVFSKIRFLQMKNSQFKECVRDVLLGRLPKKYISDICVAYCTNGADQDYFKEAANSVDRRLRNI